MSKTIAENPYLDLSIDKSVEQSKKLYTLVCSLSDNKFIPWKATCKRYLFLFEHLKRYPLISKKIKNSKFLATYVDQMRNKDEDELKEENMRLSLYEKENEHEVMKKKSKPNNEQKNILSSKFNTNNIGLKKDLSILKEKNITDSEDVFSSDKLNEYEKYLKKKKAEELLKKMN